MTAAFALAMTLVIAAMGVFVYERQETQLDEIVETSLRSRSDDVAALVRSSDTSSLRGRRAAAGRVGRGVHPDPHAQTVACWTARPRTACRHCGPPRRGAPRASPLMLERHVRRRRRAGADPRAAGALAGQNRWWSSPAPRCRDRDDTLTTLARSFLIGGPIAVLLALGRRLPARDDRLPAGRGDAPAGASGSRSPARTSGCRCRTRTTRSGGSGRRSTTCSRGSRSRSSGAAVRRGRKPRAADTARGREGRARGGDAGGGNGGDVRESLVAALEETDHLAQLAEDLLLIARSADGQLPVRPEERASCATCSSARGSASPTGRASRAAGSTSTRRRTCGSRSTRCAAARRSGTSSTTPCATAPAISASAPAATEMRSRSTSATRAPVSRRSWRRTRSSDSPAATGPAHAAERASGSRSCA